MGKQGVTDQRTLETAGREAGRRETVQTVQEFLGISIDHFAEVNLAGFYDMASALGGVQVCLNHPVTQSAFVVPTALSWECRCGTGRTRTS